MPSSNNKALFIVFDEQHGLARALFEFANVKEALDEFELCFSSSLRETVEGFLEKIDPVFFAFDFKTRSLLHINFLLEVADQIKSFEVHSAGLHAEPGGNSGVRIP